MHSYGEMTSDDEVPIPAAMLVDFPEMASSSQTVLPSEPEINFSQIMEALAAIQGGMSTIQQSIRECLKYHHLGSSDDEDDAPGTAPMAEDD